MTTLALWPFAMSQAVETLLRFRLIKYFLVATVCLINEFFLHIFTYTSADISYSKSHDWYFFRNES